MSFLPRGYSPPFEMSEAQRGLYEALLCECASLYFPQLPTHKATKLLKDRLKEKLNFTTSHQITRDQFNQAIHTLQTAIKAKQPPTYFTQ